ncbi:hypothetical protein JXA56_01585, partial [Candidatus Micrarchaeota archaeon]|nr:hypothetical protein [Candidatus Micrarchaeota archaeon]
MDESPQELLIIASYHDVFDERRKAFVMLCDMLHDPSNFLGACKAIYTLSSEKFDEDSKDQNRTFRKIAESAAALAARLLLSKINSDASAGNFRAVLAVLEDPDIFQNARIAANYLLEPTAENAIKRSTNIIGDEELQVELIEITLSPRITPDIKQKASRRLSYLAAIIGELKSEKSAQDLLIIASHHENNQERMQAIATLCSWISYPGKEACACRSIRMLSKSSGIQDAEVAKEIKTAKYLAISYLLDNLEAHVAAGNYCEVSGLAGDQTLFSTVRDAANSNLETTAMQ